MLYNAAMIFTPQKLKSFHTRLERWYQAHGRHTLPWRNTRDPYAIYLSEVMLQQTQVKTVLERYYHPFLQAFPTLQKLAKAPVEKVLKLWEGLGYYSRARNLHRAAVLANGIMPDEVEGLMALPGIGKNTAYAIAAFAYHQPVPLLEANVKRVITRIFALTHPTDQQLWDGAFALLNTKKPFNYNQAMMDIGAMVCTRHKPDCPACPANHMCKGQAVPENYPAPRIKKKVPVRKRNIIVFENARGDFFLQARESKMLGGLYGFIESEDSIIAFDGTSYALQAYKPLGTISQSYSHYTLIGTVYRITHHGAGNDWHSLRNITKLPLSRADQKIIGLLNGS